MRPQHIPQLVEKGTYDVGICGYDCVHEANTEVVQLAELPYGRGSSTGQARVVLVSGNENRVSTMRGVPPNSRVISEYPNITRRAFGKLGIPVEVEFSYGGTEAHIPGDYEFGVCLTDTGASLTANGLKIVEVLLQTKTILVANRRLMRERVDPIKALTHLLVGALEAREHVFLVMNVSAGRKDELLGKLPAFKTPTITPLAGEKYFSVGTVVRKETVSALIPALLISGAEDLLVMPVSTVIKHW
jgi:ATP phosphoribosyltransferase